MARTGGEVNKRTLSESGVITRVISPTVFECAELAGYDDEFFQDWDVWVVRKNTGTGAAPQSDKQPCSVYVSATGRFTTTVFDTGPLTVGDQIYLIQPFVSENTLIDDEPSNDLKQSSNVEVTTTALAYTKVKELAFTGKLGGARIRFDMHVDNVVGIASAVIYKNGVPITTNPLSSPIFTEWTDATGVYQTFTQDISALVVGDLIQIYAKVSAAPRVAYVRNFRIYYDIVHLPSVQAGIDSVFLDTIRGVAGTQWPIGTASHPSNNLTDTLAIARAWNTNVIRVIGALTPTQDCSNLVFIGDNGYSVGATGIAQITLNGQNYTNTVFINISIKGTAIAYPGPGSTVGFVTCIKCILSNPVNLWGWFDDCGISGITPVNNTTYKKCTWNGNLDLQLNIGSHRLEGVTGANINIQNQTVSTVTIHGYGGATVTIQPSCTGGTINIYGSCKVTNNTGGTVVNDYSIETALGVPGVDAVANVLERDVVGNKADTAVAVVGLTASEMAYIKGILNVVNSIAGGAYWQSFGPGNVQVANAVTHGITLFDPGGGIIPAASITPGTYTLDRIRVGVLTNIVAATPTPKTDGAVYVNYAFPGASWAVGDLALYTFSSIQITIAGIVTSLPPIQVWARVVTEPDILSLATTINTVQGAMADAATADDLSDVTTTSTQAKIRRILLRMSGAGVFSADIQGLARTELDTMLAQLAIYFNAAGAAMSVVSQPGVAARTNLNDILTDLANILAGLAGITNFPAGAAAANGISVAAVARYIQETILGYEGATALANKLTAARAALLDQITAARLAELDAANLPADVDTLKAAIGAIEGATTLHNKLTAARAALLDQITALRLAELDPANLPADVAAISTELANATYGLSALETLVDDLETRLTAARAGYIDELAAANIPADIDKLIASGLAYKATVSEWVGLFEFKASDLTGYGNAFFKNWGVWVIWDAAGGGALPQGVRQTVTSYNSADGDMTVDGGFGGNPVAAGDKILLVAPPFVNIFDYVLNVNLIVTDVTYGLSALKALIDAISALLSNGTYGLAALETLVDDLESRLTAARAGYLDELAAANLPADIDTLKASQARQLFTMDFWSIPQKTVVIPIAAADQALPDVTVASLPAGATVVKATVMFKARSISNAGAANKLTNAQEIQIRTDAPGAWADAINFVDDQFLIAAAAVDAPGDVVMGALNVAAVVTGNDTYNIQWDEAIADVANLTFTDVQVGIRIWYSV